MNVVIFKKINNKNECGWKRIGELLWGSVWTWRKWGRRKHLPFGNPFAPVCLHFWWGIVENTDHFGFVVVHLLGKKKKKKKKSPTKGQGKCNFLHSKHWKPLFLIFSSEPQSKAISARFLYLVGNIPFHFPHIHGGHLVKEESGNREGKMGPPCKSFYPVWCLGWVPSRRRDRRKRVWIEVVRIDTKKVHSFRRFCPWEIGVEKQNSYSGFQHSLDKALMMMMLHRFINSIGFIL